VIELDRCLSATGPGRWPWNSARCCSPHDPCHQPSMPDHRCNQNPSALGAGEAAMCSPFAFSNTQPTSWLGPRLQLIDPENLISRPSLMQIQIYYIMYVICVHIYICTDLKVYIYIHTGYIIKNMYIYIIHCIYLYIQYSIHIFTIYIQYILYIYNIYNIYYIYNIYNIYYIYTMYTIFIQYIQYIQYILYIQYIQYILNKYTIYVERERHAVYLRKYFFGILYIYTGLPQSMKWEPLWKKNNQTFCCLSDCNTPTCHLKVDR
jgi:hypothetical protein